MSNEEISKLGKTIEKSGKLIGFKKNLTKENDI